MLCSSTQLVCSVESVTGSLALSFPKTLFNVKRRASCSELCDRKRFQKSTVSDVDRIGAVGGHWRSGAAAEVVIGEVHGRVANVEQTVGRV